MRIVALPLSAAAAAATIAVRRASNTSRIIVGIVFGSIVEHTAPVARADVAVSVVIDVVAIAASSAVEARDGSCCRGVYRITLSC